MVVSRPVPTSKEPFALVPRVQRMHASPAARPHRPVAIVLLVLVVIGLLSVTLTPTPPERPVTMAKVAAGGHSTAEWVADRPFVNGDYKAGHESSESVDLSQVTNPAPASVYQTSRFGRVFSYTFGNLAPNAKYSLRAHFVESYWEEPGKRIFDVAWGGIPLLRDFDIHAEAGGNNRAIARSWTLTSTPTGKLTVTFSAQEDYATVNGVEIASVTPLRVAAGAYAAEGWADGAGHLVGESTASATSAEIDTESVVNPAPQEVYRHSRTGQEFGFRFEGLNPGSVMEVRLHWAEPYWCLADRSGERSPECPGHDEESPRAFDVLLNDRQVLDAFDLRLHTGGRKDVAIARHWNVPIGDDGTLRIDLIAVAGEAILNGIELAPAGPAAAMGSNEMPTISTRGWTFAGGQDFLIDAPAGRVASSRQQRVDGIYDDYLLAYGEGWPSTYGGTYSFQRNVSVHNGYLEARARYLDESFAGAAWIFRLPDDRSIPFLYGAVEARVRVVGDAPTYKIADLLWPASDRWSDGEIDFPEGTLGSGSEIMANHHCLGLRPDLNCSQFPTGVTWGDWHIVRIEWSARGTSYYLDGVLLGTNTNATPRKPMHWVNQLELERDGEYVEHNPEDEALYQVDWMRFEFKDS